MRSDIERIFTGIKVESVKLVELAVAACEASHGALLIIAEDAQSEVIRLIPQCTPIEPVMLNPDLVASATAIDGALFIDPLGVCHGIGAILDGRAKGFGDPSRGARFNSALRYVTDHEAKCLAIIVSEDGNAQWVPDLEPQISQHSLTDIVSLAQQQLGASPESFSLSRASRLLEQLRDLTFYMSPEMCDLANQLINRFHEVEEQKAGCKPISRYTEFVPSAELDESYFY